MEGIEWLVNAIKTHGTKKLDKLDSAGSHAVSHHVNKTVPLSKEKMDVATNAFKGKNDLSELTDVEIQQLIEHYQQFELHNSANKKLEVAQALNWARIQYLKGGGSSSRPSWKKSTL